MLYTKFSIGRVSSKMSCSLLYVFLPIILLNILGTAYPFARGCSTKSSSQNIFPLYNSNAVSVQSRLDEDTQHLCSLANNIQGFTRLSLPQSKKNFFQRVLFGWPKELLDKGNKRPDNEPLELTDIWKLNDNDQMKNVSARFDYFYSKEIEDIGAQTKKLDNILQLFWSYPLTRAIMKMYKKEFIFTGVLKFINTLVQFFPSLLIARILHLVTTASTSTIVPKNFSLQGVGLSLLLFIALSSKTILENSYFFHVINLSASVRGAISTAIYKKSLRLNPQGRQKFTLGEVSNYLQLDTNRLEQVAGSIHTVWDGLFQIIGYTSLLLAFLGPSVFAGIAALLIIIPLNAYFLIVLSGLRTANLKFTDNRVKLTNEILQGIRAIKSYNWENPFLLLLNKIRGDEIEAMKSAANIRAILVSILSAAPSFVAVVTLSLYAYLGNDLNPTKVFTALALFNQLRFPIIFFPLLLNTLAEGKVSLMRISSFLSSSEIQNYVQNPSLSSTDPTYPYRAEKGRVAIINGEFSWSQSSSHISDSKAGSSTSSLENDVRGKLRNVTINIRPGELVAVVGPVGSGKTQLVSALLGEQSLINGSVQLDGRVAYVPQTAWIPNESLRNVILFGREYDEKRYADAVSSCGLLKDLSNLESGDETEIGERGVNLSGGQKQRISLARAVYDNADIYIFDDPLSALDADVSQNVFNQCIDGILSSKTRILVTHQLRVLPQVDRIILMNVTTDGACQVIDQGNLYELYSRGYDLSKLVKSDDSDEKSQSVAFNTSTVPVFPSASYSDPNIDPLIISNGIYNSSSDSNQLLDTAEDDSMDKRGVPSDEGSYHDGNSVETKIFLESLPPTEGMIEYCYAPDGTPIDCPVGADTNVANENYNLTEESHEHTTPLETLESSSALNRRKLPGSSLPLPKISQTRNEPAINEPSVIVTKPVKRLIAAEERGEGAVSWPVYKKYISSAKSPLLILSMLISFALANIAQIGQLWVVSAWTSDVGYKKVALRYYLIGMAAMASAVAFFTWSRTYLQYIIGANASNRLHFEMTASVLKAPLSFFESTPVGRLMQRFSKDLDSMDQQLPGSFGQLIASALSIAGAMAAVCFATPAFAVVMVPLLALYMYITNYYRKSARELKRLDSISRSPIYAHFSETLGGLSVIRSFRRQAIYKRVNEVKLDDNLGAYYALKAVDRWLSLRLEFLGNSIVFLSSLLAIASRSKAGVTGISLNNALSITSLLNWAVRNGAETESLMNSVERVLYIATNTPSEKVDYDTTAKPVAYYNGTYVTSTTMSEADLVSSSWPWRGGIVFNNVTMSYRDDFLPVLRGVNLRILPGERIGVVGRTGSGKSSLFRALLRLTEVQQSGAIFVDGVDLKSISMNTLRSAVSVIPQDPVLFTGTLRFNLDPFNMRTDEELWLSLKKANLESTIRALPGGLYHMVSEGGENFSAGQRQLICLARALVRKSKLLLLDEATSSVDMETDVIIQKAIREEFSEISSTVLTIAHRLDTIIDADRILVMDNGRVAELDTPKNLLKNKDSLFAQLIRAESNPNGNSNNNRRSHHSPKVPVIDNQIDFDWNSVSNSTITTDSKEHVNYRNIYSEDVITDTTISANVTDDSDPLGSMHESNKANSSAGIPTTSR